MTCNITTPLQNPFLDEMFDNLQILCNIFIVKADNLKQVCSEDPYVSPYRVTNLIINLYGNSVKSYGCYGSVCVSLICKSSLCVRTAMKFFHPRLTKDL